MGEYFFVINIDRKEYVGIPSKYGEHIENPLAPIALFWLLTKKKDPRYPTLGRWTGDRVLVIGDSDMEYEWVAEEMVKGTLKDITIEVYKDLAKWCRERDIVFDDAFEDMARWLTRLRSR